MKILCGAIGMAWILSLVQIAGADTGVNKATQNEKTFTKYGLTGKGVIVPSLTAASITPIRIFAMPTARRESE